MLGVGGHWSFDDEGRYCANEAGDMMIMIRERERFISVMQCIIIHCFLGYKNKISNNGWLS